MLKEFGVSNRNGYSFRPATKVLEAPSNEGAFLVSETPHREATGGGVLVTVGVCPSGPMAVLIWTTRTRTWL